MGHAVHSIEPPRLRSRSLLRSLAMAYPTVFRPPSGRQGCRRERDAGKRSEILANEAHIVIIQEEMKSGDREHHANKTNKVWAYFVHVHHVDEQTRSNCSHDTTFYGRHKTRHCGPWVIWQARRRGLDLEEISDPWLKTCR